MNSCDIEIAIALQDEVVVQVACDSEVEVLVDVDLDIEVLAFDWPPLVEKFERKLYSEGNMVYNLDSQGRIGSYEGFGRITTITRNEQGHIVGYEDAENIWTIVRSENKIEFIHSKK